MMPIDDDDLFDDDFDDEDLDDFDLDDDFDDEDDWADEEPNQKSNTSSASSPTQKTFLQKYFNFVVIAIVTIMGGLWFLGQSSSPQKTDADTHIQTETSQQNTDHSVDASPPLSGASSSKPSPSDAEYDASQTQQTGANLYPKDVNKNDNTHPPMPVPTGPVSNVTPEHSILTPLPINDPVLFDQRDSTHVVDMPEPKNKIPGMALPGFEKQASPTALLDINDNKNDEQTVPTPLISDLPAVDQPQNNEVRELEVKNTSETQKPTPQKSETKHTIDALQLRIDTLSNQLTTQMAEADKKIDTLTKTIEALSKKLESKAVALPERNVTPVPVKTPKKEEKTTKKQKRKVKTASWELRSAQPNKAVVVRNGTNDFRTIEPGDSLSGIGKIKSIQYTNGQWIVQGTHGKISR